MLVTKNIFTALMFAVMSFGSLWAQDSPWIDFQLKLNVDFGRTMPINSFVFQEEPLLYQGQELHFSKPKRTVGFGYSIGFSFLKIKEIDLYVSLSVNQSSYIFEPFFVSENPVDFCDGCTAFHEQLWLSTLIALEIPLIQGDRWQLSVMPKFGPTFINDNAIRIYDDKDSSMGSSSRSVMISGVPIAAGADVLLSYAPVKRVSLYFRLGGLNGFEERMINSYAISVGNFEPIGPFDPFLAKSGVFKASLGFSWVLFK